MAEEQPVRCACGCEPSFFSVDKDKQLNWRVRCFNCGAAAGGLLHARESTLREWADLQKALRQGGATCTK
jgi:hypothetical protein